MMDIDARVALCGKGLRCHHPMLPPSILVCFTNQESAFSYVLRSGHQPCAARYKSCALRYVALICSLGGSQVPFPGVYYGMEFNVKSM